MQTKIPKFRQIPARHLQALLQSVAVRAPFSCPCRSSWCHLRCPGMFFIASKSYFRNMREFSVAPVPGLPMASRCRFHLPRDKVLNAVLNDTGYAPWPPAATSEGVNVPQFMHRVVHLHEHICTDIQIAWMPVAAQVILSASVQATK